MGRVCFYLEGSKSIIIILLLKFVLSKWVDIISENAEFSSLSMNVLSLFFCSCILSAYYVPCCRKWNVVEVKEYIHEIVDLG